jgi:hypothetical protein
MTIGVISDTHGNLWGWQRAWELVLGEADVVIHCGDLLYHGPKFKPAEAYDPKALADAINAAGKPVLIARGNADADVDQLVLQVPIQQPYVFTQLEGLRLLAAHGHLMSPDDLGAMCLHWGVDFLLTGHTHVPLLRDLGGCLHLNPGTPTYPLDADESKRRPTCAVIRDGQATILDLRTGDPVPA